MSDLAPRPRSATEIIDAAFQLYRRAPGQIIVASAVLLAPATIVRLILTAKYGAVVPTATLTPGDGAAAFSGVATQLLSVMLPFLLVTVLMLGILEGTFADMASNLYLGREADALASIRRSLRQGFAVTLLTIIRIVAVGIGFVFLFVPGIFVGILLFAPIQAVMIEGVPMTRSFGRSSSLSRGLKLHIFVTAVITYFIVLVASFGGNIISALAFAKNPNAQAICTYLVAMLVTPIGLLAWTVLYYDARIRREGYDIELMAAMATPAVATS